MKKGESVKMPDCIGDRKRKRKMWEITVLLFACIILIISIILPPSTGKPAPFLDENRNLLEGSISEKISVEINGIQQGMFIKGRDINKPVLLLLHGGPGLSDYFLTKEYPTDLEDEFVVCYWEQRGTGLSYHSSTPAETMTTEQFVMDTITVTNYLRERFGKEKIYLMGHSWGTYLGIQAAAAAPDLYFAYISMSQVVAQEESEKIAYDYMLQQYKSVSNERMIQKFEAYPIMESDEALKEYSGSLLRDEAMHDLGVGTMRSMKSVISGIFFPSLRCTDYTPLERLNIWRGKAFSRETGLRDELSKFDAIAEVPSIDIPVYFFAGLYDYTCCYSLQKKYFESIKAPVKAFYTFDESAHSPLFEEPEKALEILSEDVLKGLTALQAVVS